MVSVFPGLQRHLVVEMAGTICIYTVIGMDGH